MSNEELSYDFSLVIKVYKDGRVERLLGTATVPPSTQPETGVQSKDIVISQQPAISVRLYIPKSAATKLPLLVYFHGGGFCIQSASSPTYHNYLNSLVSEVNVVAVSVEYRLAPEHPIPAAYVGLGVFVRKYHRRSGRRMRSIQAKAIVTTSTTAFADAFVGGSNLWSNKSFRSNSTLLLLDFDDSCSWDSSISPGCLPIMTSSATAPKLYTSYLSVTRIVYASFACQ